VKFATKELALSQHLVDRLPTPSASRADGSAARQDRRADERGVALTITEETRLPADADDFVLTPQEMVTVLATSSTTPWTPAIATIPGWKSPSSGPRATAHRGRRQRTGDGRRDLPAGDAARLLDKSGVTRAIRVLGLALGCANAQIQRPRRRVSADRPTAQW